MKKRCLSFALALALCLCLLPAAALAADSDFTIEDGVLTKYNGPGGDVVIPDGVTSIGTMAFDRCSDLTSVTISASVISLDFSAFQSCDGLVSFHVAEDNPNYSEKDGALFNKDQTTLIRYPTGRAGAYAIPDSVTHIDPCAFQDCKQLTDITIPNGVTSIGWGAFISCEALTSIIFPDGITTNIEFGMFSGCKGLTSVTIPNSVTYIGPGAFSGCNGLTSFTIPSSVTNIGADAFRGCTGLTSITIPSSVTSIESLAFESCTSLSDIYYGGTEAQWTAVDIIGNQALRSATIHYNSSAATTAYASTQTVTVDGKAVELQAYALKDENGNLTNYVKLRDIADLLDGTLAQFNVGWDGTVNILTRTPYTSRNGQENQTPYSGDRAYAPATSETKVNGAAASLDAFVLTDDAGNGSTYYKLRDLGQTLGFNVGWADGTGIFVESGKPYDANN